VNHRNGYRKREWDTRTGTIPLSIPKLRRGSYFPDWLLTPRRRAERALFQVVSECYVRGVSTRRVDGLVKAMGVRGISKSQVSEMAKELDEMVDGFRDRPLEDGPYHYVWLDAITQRVREGGRVVNSGGRRHGGQLGRPARHLGLRCLHHRGLCRLDDLPALLGGPRLKGGPTGHLRRS